MTNKARSMVAVGVVAALAAFLAVGCHGIPQGTQKQATVGAVQLHASGAGIVSADAQKTTFKIKCALCGFEAEPITIDTPAAGKPYTLDWVCPKCGHKQRIEISVAAATP